MKTYKDISRCDSCFRVQMAIGAQSAKTEEITNGVAMPRNQTYMHDCDFCEGDSKQVWVNFGQFSQCQGC